jgi:hypothetical protein
MNLCKLGFNVVQHVYGTATGKICTIKIPDIEL